MPDLALTSLRMLALALFAMSSAAPVRSQDLRTQACQVRPHCAVLVSPTARCESILDWVGQCSGGFAQGPGAVHYADATATYGVHNQGRLTGAFVWHRNGIATAIGQYETQLVSLDAAGNSDGAILACTWDEESERLVGDRTDSKCIQAAAQLGAQAFSPAIWRTFAKRMTARLRTPGPTPSETTSRHVALKAVKPVAQSSPQK